MVDWCVYIYIYIYIFVNLLRFWLKVKLTVAWSCTTLCDPWIACPKSSVHGILQAEILEWVAILFSWGSFWPRDWTCVSCIAGRFFYLLSHQGSPRFCCTCILFCPFPVIWPQSSTVTGKKGQTNLGSYHVSVSLSPVKEHHLPMFSQWPVGWLPSCRVHARHTHQVKLPMRPSQVCNFYTIISCWGAGQHTWITASKQQLNFSTCCLLFITGDTQLRTNKTCCVCVRYLAIPWTVACQAPLSVGFSRQEYWSELLCPPPRDLPDPGLEPRSPALRADSLPFEPRGKPEKPLLSHSHIYAASNAFRLLQVKNEHVYLVGFFFLFLVCLLCHTVS